MEQLNLFEVLYEKYKIKKTIRLIELFGGIGSQAKALENLHANFKHYKLVEFDKYPVASYNAVHGTHFEPIDITEIHASDLEIVDRDNYEYIMTYSFPCQDLSIAGKGRGMKKGSGTRSGLLWEVERLLTECNHDLPQILLMENVPNVVGDKNINDFRAWQQFLESKGYSNYVELLNAKDYGIPQNRQRCFMISILGEVYYEFPKPIPLKLRLKDMLEPEETIDEKYYLSDALKKYIFGNAIDPTLKDMYNRNDAYFNKDVAYTLNTHSIRRIGDSNYIIPDIDHEIKVSEVIKDIKVGDSYNKKLTDPDVSGCIVAGKGRNQGSMIIIEEGIPIKEETKKGYAVAKEGDSISLERPDSKTRRGRVGNGVAQTLLTSCDQGVVVDYSKESPKCIGGFGKKYNDDYQYAMQHRVYDDKIATSITTAFMPFYKNNLVVRKLTPKECWRLMGFSDEDFDKAAKVNSDAQLYKQAGNSIVVNVLMAIFSQLL